MTVARRKLPPLNALRAFEAAARLNSIRAAAGELFVTPAAVSQQVKALELHLGMKLFRRLTRGLAMTAEGVAYYREAAAALDRLALATERLAAGSVAGPVRVSVIPSLANRWLARHLADFTRRYPEVALTVLSDVRPVDFARDPFEVGLRYGRGDYPGLRVDFLMDETLFPVCAPSLMVGRHPLRHLSDLRHHTLVHEAVTPAAEPWSSWPPWIEAAGLTGAIDLDRGPRFNDSATVLRAVTFGLGVAVGRARLIGDELRSGQLVRPFAVERRSNLAYYVVSPPDVAELPRVTALREWLLETAAADAPEPE